MVVESSPYPSGKITNSVVVTQRVFYTFLRFFNLACWLAILAVGQIDRSNPLWGVFGIVGTIWVCWVFNMSRPLTAGIYFMVLYSIGQSNFVFDRGLPQVLQYLDDLVLLLLFGLLARLVIKKLPIVRFVWRLVFLSIGLGMVSGLVGDVPLWVVVIALARSLLMGPLLMMLVIWQLSLRDEWHKFYGLFLLIILASFACYVGQFLRVRNLFPENNEDLYYGLMGGGFANDNSLLMAMLAAVWLAKYLFGAPRRKTLDLLILVGLVLAAFVSKSLTVIYAGPLITAGCLTLIWLRGKRKGNAKRNFHVSLFFLGWVLLFVLIVGLLTGVAGSLWTGINERMSGIIHQLSYGNADTVNRFWLIRYVWEMGFPTTWNLILGHGPGSFMSSTANNGIYRSHIWGQLLGNLPVRYVAPSLLASRLVEYGILGTVLNLILYLGIIWWVLRNGRMLPSKSRWLAFGFAIAGGLVLPFYVLGGAFEVQGISNMYWLLAGLVFSNALGYSKS